MILRPHRSILFPYTTLFRSYFFRRRNIKKAAGNLLHGILILLGVIAIAYGYWLGRSEEHTSELQSRGHLVCRLLLEKKKQESHIARSVSINARYTYIVYTSY